MRRRAWQSWLPQIFLLLSILFLALHETRVLAPVERALQVLLAPLQRGMTEIVRDVGNLFQTVREVRELREQVAVLQEQVNTLTIENIRLREFEAEATQLRALLGFVQANPTWAYLGADVIGRSACVNAPCADVIGQEPNPYIRTLTINAGEAEGIRVGMPVVTGGAVLVGRVARVSLHTSQVQLITDPGSSIAAILQQSRATGLLVGQPDGSLRMVYIPQEDQVPVGDVVLTSGLGGAFPRGLVLGQVLRVIRQDFALFQEAEIHPAVDYRRVEWVLVITSFQPFVQEEPAE